MENYNEMKAHASCTHHPASEMPWLQVWNPAQRAILRQNQVTVLRAWEPSIAAANAHIGFGDCTHFGSAGGPLGNQVGQLASLLGSMRLQPT